VNASSLPDKNAVTNPTLLVERCPSVATILVVSHRRPQVTVFERVGATWEQREVRAGENVVVREPKLSFAVNELYAGIALEA
jgi:hypothetical protein